MPSTVRNRRDDPYLAYRFQVELDHQVVAGFSDVHGLEVESQVETFREGGQNAFERHLAGPMTYSSRLVLKRGLTNSQDLWKWHREVAAGKVVRKSLSILMFDDQGEKARTWKFHRACPVKWSGPTFAANSTDVAFESLELVHEGTLP